MQLNFGDLTFCLNKRVEQHLCLLYEWYISWWTRHTLGVNLKQIMYFASEGNATPFGETYSMLLYMLHGLLESQTRGIVGSGQGGWSPTLQHL